jgi:hypothetical protein
MLLDKRTKKQPVTQVNDDTLLQKNVEVN